MESNNVNLFQNQSIRSPQFLLIERYLRVARIVLLAILCVGGIIVLGTFFLFRAQQQSLDRQRAQLYSIVQNNIAKEGMLVTLRARVQSLKKIMQYQVSIAPYIDTALLIATPPNLTSFSLGDASSVQISVDSATVEEAIGVVETIIRLTNEQKIKNPVVTSIVLSKDGRVTMGFVYVTVLTQPTL